MSNREEKEKFDINFSCFEKRKRNSKKEIQVSRREGEFCQEVLWDIFIFSQFPEEKENLKIISPISRWEREI